MAATNKEKNKPQTYSKSSNQKTSNKKQSGTKKSTFESSPEEESSRREILCFTCGALLCLFSIFTLLAIISYIFTGSEDYRFVTEECSPHANIMGKLGAYIAYFFVTHNFGFASIFIACFLFMAGLRIFFMGEKTEDKRKKPSKENSVEMAKKATQKDAVRQETPLKHIRLWKWFINFGILTIWWSLFLASISNDIFTSWSLFPGGKTGFNMVTSLDEYIGAFFRYVVLIVVAIAYLCYLSSETIRIIRKWVRKPVVIIQDKLVKDNKTDNEERLIIDPDTGEVLGTRPSFADEDSGDETAENETEWEFRGGEESAENAKNIDKNTATTILFSVDGKPIDETSPTQESQQLDFLDNKNFVVDTGIEEDQSEPEPAMDDEENLKYAPTKSDAGDMLVTIGEVNEEAQPDENGSIEPYDPKLDLEFYRYPKLNLLKHYDIDARAVDMDEQTKNKNQIINALRNFGVEISSIKATVGPTITLYEITPAPGVRISKIRNLEDDIALSLSALSTRIIAPIPGKGTIGIEVPNAKPQIVSMESVINSKKFQESDMELPMALGRTITNEIFMADLAKMPHLLVAGATGQGKSVGLNAIITSLLYKKHPAELKIVMVDPKMVEFSVYSPIVNHFLAQVEGNEDTEEPIITDVTKVIQTLKSLCIEMDTRYELLKKAGARTVKEYNEMFKTRQLNPNNGHKFMPYIVVIIDEYGDLIMTAGKEIELPIARIAQKARAVGMHMIIATQRPTTNIITGTIKANFPARMAFRVGSMIDSRTILDRPGANQLVGKGDMLFLTGQEPVRVQCAFVDTPEVKAINSFIACQQSYHGPFPLPFVEMEGTDNEAPDVDLTHLDAMFDEVARLVVSSQQGSTSMIQRKFSIGYNRAGRLMDQLEVAGIVGPAHGSKPREVLCQSEIDLEMKLQELRG
ncbi:MAG: DNA translocase FtsK 4TM domain-containing protein [Bacteroidales bacterium]|nr:DNA translocase FtsK 4TM domain-containing protein [Candidatus Physcousia equi]